MSQKIYKQLLTIEFFRYLKLQTEKHLLKMPPSPASKKRKTETQVVQPVETFHDTVKRKLKNIYICNQVA